MLPPLYSSSKYFTEDINVKLAFLPCIVNVWHMAEALLCAYVASTANRRVNGTIILNYI